MLETSPGLSETAVIPNPTSNDPPENDPPPADVTALRYAGKWT